MGRSANVYVMESKGPSVMNEEEISLAGPIVRKQGISANLTLINFLKGMIGPGCFSLPLALKSAGLWGGFGLIFGFGIVTCVNMMKLVRCSQYLSNVKGHHSLDYGNMAEESFKNSFESVRTLGPTAKHFVNICLLFLQIGVCSVFYIFVTDHAKEILDVIWSQNGVTQTVVFLVALIPFILLCCVRGIKQMSYVSLFGNILMIGSLVIILQALCRSPHIVNDLPAFTDFNGILLASGSILYSFEGQAMVLPLENKLKHPSEMTGYTGVLSTGMSVVTIIYGACGFFGYITYGDKVEGSITLNLPDTPLNFLVKILLMLVVFTGYLVQHYVIIEMIFPSIKRRLQLRQISRAKTMLVEYSFRICIVVLSMLLSLAIPNLEDIIPLIGVSAGMLLALIIPPFIEWFTFLPLWLRKRQYLTIFLHSTSNIFFVLLGIMFMIFGLKSNIEKLISEKEK